MIFLKDKVMTKFIEPSDELFIILQLLKGELFIIYNCLKMT